MTNDATRASAEGLPEETPSLIGAIDTLTRARGVARLLLCASEGLQLGQEREAFAVGCDQLLDLLTDVDESLNAIHDGKEGEA